MKVIGLKLTEESEWVKEVQVGLGDRAGVPSLNGAAGEAGAGEGLRRSKQAAGLVNGHERHLPGAQSRFKHEVGL